VRRRRNLWQRADRWAYDHWKREDVPLVHSDLRLAFIRGYQARKRDEQRKRK